MEDSFGSQQGFSTVASVAAWGLPAAYTIAVLVTRDVDADELTGKGPVGSFSFTGQEEGLQEGERRSCGNYNGLMIEHTRIVILYLLQRNSFSLSRRRTLICEMTDSGEFLCLQPRLDQ